MRGKTGTAWRYLMLLDLPFDVLLNISWYLSPADVLVLDQTCRVLHAFTCSDYVWHRLSIDMPPVNHPITSLSGAALRHTVISALRLDHNWRKRSPRVGCINIRKNLKDASIMQLQLLGNRHVLVLSRWPDHDELSVWTLNHSLDSRRYRSIPMIQFAAVTASGNCEATVVALCNNQEVIIYPLPLDDVSERPICPSNHIPGPPEGRISVIELCNDVITTIVARFPENFGLPTYTVMFYNTASKRRFLYEFAPLVLIDRLQIKLYPTCFVLTGVRENSLVAWIHGLPSILFLGNINPETPTLTTEQCPLLAEHVLGSSSTPIEFYVSSEPAHECPSHFSLFAFHSFGEHAKGLADVYHIPLDTSRRRTQFYMSKPTHSFKTAIGKRPEIVCFGKTGFRAVWLDHEWDSDEYSLWKATFPPGEAASVSPLLPPHHPLPFEVHMITSLAFDEATGRICVGLRTGAVYVLEL